MEENKVKDEKWYKLCRCSGEEKGRVKACKKQVRIEEKDLGVKTVMYHNRTKTQTIIFICPICGALTEIEDIPEEIRNNCLEKFGN